MTNFEKARDEASQLYCIDRTGNKYTDPLSFRAGADWGYEKGRAEMQAELDAVKTGVGIANPYIVKDNLIKRLERELAEAKRMLDYERSAVDRLMECEANEAAQKGQYRAKVERLTAERDEWRQEALKHIDWLHAEQDETERLKTELAKREGELHMNSDCNVEKLHMNSKGEPAKCEPENSIYTPFSEHAPAGWTEFTPSFPAFSAKNLTPEHTPAPCKELIDTQPAPAEKAREYMVAVTRAELRAERDALKADRDRWREMCERLAGEMEYMLCEDQLCPLCHEIRQTLAKYERMKNG